MPKQREVKLCPCSSGKEYRHCCGVSNVIELDKNKYNRELHNLHLDLLAFALEEFEDVFMEQIYLYGNFFSLENNQADADFFDGITFWTILSVPINESNQTIFDIFYHHNKGNIKFKRSKKTFSTWGACLPSFYKVISIDPDQEKAIVKCEWTNEEFLISYMEEDEIVLDQYVIGTLIPFIGYHHFFFTKLNIQNEHDIKLLSSKRESEQQADIKHTFPAMLAYLLQLDTRNLSWDNNLHEQAAKLFTDQMIESQVDPGTITIGVNTWHAYCTRKMPRIKNYTAYAAALEYFIWVDIISRTDVTQKEIASKYVTSANTLSVNYQKISNFYKENNRNAYRIKDEGISLQTESDLLKIQQLLTDQEFNSMNEINDFLDKTLQTNQGEIKQSPVLTLKDKAQSLTIEAYNTTGNKREELINEALTIDPTNIDAYLLLAEDATHDLECLQLLEDAVIIGEETLGRRFLLENKGNFWGLIETRPYMRAKEMYAHMLFVIGDEEEALRQYEEMIELNPNDAQGIRYPLLSLYIEMEQWHKAAKLLSKYDEENANFLFNRVLVHYALHGITRETINLINKANTYNPYVRAFLLEEKEVPEVEVDFTSFGDEHEAITYAQEHIHLWIDLAELLAGL